MWTLIICWICLLFFLLSTPFVIRDIMSNPPYWFCFDGNKTTQAHGNFSLWVISGFVLGAILISRFLLLNLTNDCP